MSTKLSEMKLADLPEDIYGEISKYLDTLDRGILHAICRIAYHHMRQHLYLRLNRETSDNFMRSKAFREEVFRTVVNPKKQIEVNYTSIDTRCPLTRMIEDRILMIGWIRTPHNGYTVSRARKQVHHVNLSYSTVSPVIDLTSLDDDNN
jgi:hypothetical protein